jgi:hypothetical protein
LIAALSTAGMILGAASVSAGLVAFVDWGLRGRYEYRPVEDSDREAARRLRSPFVRFVVLHNRALRWTGLATYWVLFAVVVMNVPAHTGMIGSGCGRLSVLAQICPPPPGFLVGMVALGSPAVAAVMWTFLVSIDRPRKRARRRKTDD